jgi:DNA ligase-1
MKAFTDLYLALDETNKTSEKLDALRRYFESADPEDAAWAVYFLSGRKPKQVVSTKKLRQWAAEEAGVPEWLFEECYHAVGDLAEAMALVLPDNESTTQLPLHIWVTEHLLPLRGEKEEKQWEELRDAWSRFDASQRFVWNKLITGGFRVGISQQLLIRALAQVAGIDPAVIAHRMMGSWEPTPVFYRMLVAAETGDADLSRPYPFFLAYPLEEDAATLGDVRGWQVEWKWDGIRSQLIRREGESFLWSRGEEMVNERFPELYDASLALPDGTVLDGEILPWKNDRVLPFTELQQRLGRKNVTKKILSDVPVILLCYDLLELNGEDVRTRPIEWRRARLEEIVGVLPEDSPIRLSPIVESESWEEFARKREESRARGVEGFMLKRIGSPYRVGRQRGDWWKWKIDPYTIDAVLIYAQRGNGKRASLYTDYTFAVWHEGELVPFAKAYSGLTDSEIRKVDAFVRQHTVEKFGPVRSVKPELVFELAFEAIQRSSRHKSGIAVRFPRILRWRTDKKIEEADALETIHAMLPE